MSGCEDQNPLSSYEFSWHGDKIDIEQSHVWGYSPCGDLIIWSFENLAGWVNLGNHQIHLLGSISDTIEWIYNELLANRCPEWQYEWDRLA